MPEFKVIIRNDEFSNRWETIYDWGPQDGMNVISVLLFRSYLDFLVSKGHDLLEEEVVNKFLNVCKCLQRDNKGAEEKEIKIELVKLSPSSFDIQNNERTFH